LSATNYQDAAKEVIYCSSFYFESGMNRRSIDSGSVLLTASCVGDSGATDFRIQQVLEKHAVQNGDFIVALVFYLN
jgi:hypothetical protein